MSPPRITASTIGQGNSSLTGTRKPYRWRKIADWTPGDPRYRKGAESEDPLPQNVKASASRAERKAEFAGYLAQGLTAVQAGKLMKIARTTARTYEKELKEQQRGEASDG